MFDLTGGSYIISRTRKDYIAMETSSYLLSCLPESLLQSISPQTEDDSSIKHVAAQSSQALRGCITCGMEVFDSRAQQVLHYKSDLHIINLRRRMKDLPPITSEEAAVLLDLEDEEEDPGNGEDDMNDSEGSEGEIEHEDEKYDDDGDDDQQVGFVAALRNARDVAGVRHQVSKAAGPQLVFQLSMPFASQQLVVSRCLFPVLASQWSPWHSLRALTSRSSSSNKWLVLLMQSGRVAAAVFDGPKLLVHKCLKRYTIRAKSGGAQSASDASGRKAQSMGASLRRHGEQRLKEDVWHLLHMWNAELQLCDLLLL